MPSDEAVKAAREWLAHARSEERCPISDTDDALCLAALLDNIIALAKLEEAKWRLNHWPPLGALQTEESLRSWIATREVEQQDRIMELGRLAGRGK